MPEFHEPTIARLPVKGLGYALVLNDSFTHGVLKFVAWSDEKRKGYPHGFFGGHARYLNLAVYRHYHGEIPDGHLVDHIDRNPLNNLPGNLRAVTAQVNRLNSRLRSDNKSGFACVGEYTSRRSGRKNWEAQIAHKGYPAMRRYFPFTDGGRVAAARLVNRVYRERFPGEPVPNPSAEPDHSPDAPPPVLGSSVTLPAPTVGEPPPFGCQVGPGVRWAAVDGFPGYVVCSDGSVWTCRQTRRGITQRWRRMKGRTVRGYRVFRLTSPDGRLCHRAAHRLVLDAFVGARPEGLQCRHLDGDKLNNHRDNLAWGTGKQNGADKMRHGTPARGERHPSAKLTRTQVEAMRGDLMAGLPRSEAALKYGTTYVNVTKIANGATWKHLAS